MGSSGKPTILAHVWIIAHQELLVWDIIDTVAPLAVF